MLTTGGAPQPGASFFAVEALFTIVATGIALLFPRPAVRVFSAPVRVFAGFSRRRKSSVLTIAALGLLTRLAILPLSPPPQPFVHDEFSYLLAADTFSSGRLANPTHPMWKHFESFHIEMKPAYVSMYFPAPGIFLALGKVVFGHPWAGVLLSSALMCGAICWMLQGWLPPAWALLGGALTVLRIGAFSYWVDSYYGGAIPALGGALVLGALPRLLRKPAPAPGFVLAAGIAFLMNSRAYEGFLLCAPVALILIWSVWKKRRLSHYSRALAAPAALLLCCVLLTGYYNFRAFGNPLTLAYKVNRAQYAAVPVFLWQKPYAIPEYRHKVMRDFYLGWELRIFTEARPVPGFLIASAQKVAAGALFFFGLALVPPLLFLGAALRDRRIRWPVLLLCMFAAGLAGNPWFMPHYAAPFTAAIYLLLLQSMRHMGHAKNFNGPYGLAIVRLTPVLCLVLFGIRLSASPLHFDLNRFPMMWYGSAPTGLARASVVRQFQILPGQHLAVVRYAPDHVTFDEWVYNAAEIDSSKVVWARETGSSADRELLDYYPARHAWLVEPDANPPRVTPLPR